MGTDDTTRKLSDDQFNQIIARFDGMISRLDGLEQRLASLENKVDNRLMYTQPLREMLTEKLHGLESKVDGLESKVDGLVSKVDGLESKMDSMREDLIDRIDVLNGNVLELNAKYKRFQHRLSDLEQKAS